MIDTYCDYEKCDKHTEEEEKSCEWFQPSFIPLDVFGESFYCEFKNCFGDCNHIDLFDN